MVCVAIKSDAFNNTEDNSFDKNIPDADSEKIIQHHSKLKKIHAWKVHELCVENVRQKRHLTS